MKKRRKTKAEGAQEWAAAEGRCWETFRAKLAAARGYVEARLLVEQAPPTDMPGRRFYSNLGFFLGNFLPPAGSSYDEKALYLQLLQRIDAEGLLKPGARQQADEALRKAMSEQGNC